MIKLLCSERNAIFLPSYMVSLKTQATASNQGFTLVELIVVITILAILGTIGFISLQGYSGQSRDAKRTSDLRSLSTAINTKSTEGIGLINFADSASKLTAGTTAGAVLSAATDYTAGVPNFTILGVTSTSFKDGANDYRIGATSRAGGVFQVAAKLENSGTPAASVTGNYIPRTAAVYAPTAGTASSLTAPYTLNGLPATSIGNLKAGDSIWIIAATTPGVGKIVSVGADGTSAVVSSAVAVGNVTSIQLGNTSTLANDSLGLIGNIASTSPVVAANTVPVTNGGTANPY
jgi:prepilin-type N-terminal cleavage/methylation domain-containing protein